MQYRYLSLFTVLVFTLILFLACSTQTLPATSLSSSSQTPSTSNVSPTTVSVNEASTGSEVKVPLGGTLTVELSANPATGFKWELTAITDPTVIEKTSDTFEAIMVKLKEGSPPIVGTPGRELWTFKALQKGKSGLSMQYSQPWAGGTKEAQSFTLTAIVE
jgi:predicted secreted protein